MYDDEIKEYKQHLEYLKTIDITPDVFRNEIEKYKVLISALKHGLVKDMWIYKRCAISYKIHALINGTYNNDVLEHLNNLFEEVLCETQYLEKLKKIIRNINKNKSYNKVVSCIDILINLMVLHDARYDEFDYICYLDDIKYKHFGFIPNTCEKVNRKKLIRDIDNSIKSIMT